MTALQPSPVAAGAIRHDGLTLERQEQFLDVLAATGSISHASKAVGVSRTALYNLRNHPDGADFARRWNEALRRATAAMTDEAFDRAMTGTSEPVWYKGEQIGERIRHDNRLLMFLLRAHDREIYGATPAAPRPTARPAAAAARPAACDSRVLVSTLSTSQGHPETEEYPEEPDLNDPAVFRAAVRELRSPPVIRHTSKRNARRLAAKAKAMARGP